ncbi:MAG: amidohydrolase family protein, partial [Bradyrhizobium sp.]
MNFLNRLGLRRPGPPRRAAEGRFQIDGVTVINPTRDRRTDATIAVSEGAISGVSDTRTEPPSEFAGCFALPGLVDMHVHLPPDNALKLTQAAALLYLLHGVTSVREAGDLDGTAVAAARKLSDEGVHPVPRVFSCGPFVGAGKATFKNTILLADASAAAADAAAARVKATGASFLKFYEGLTEPMIRSLERACAKHGLKMMGHVPAGITYEDARIAEVQHFFGVPEPGTLERDALVNRSCDWHAVDERRMDRIVETTLKYGIANTPTIVTNQRMLCYRDFEAARRHPDMLRVPPFYLDVIWHPDRASNRMARDYLERQVAPAIVGKQQLAKKLFDAGAQLYLGTDVAQPFVIPGASLLEEMALFADAGINAEQVWKLATSDAGDRLGVRGLGRIETDAPADILLFRRDPTQTIGNISSLEAVVAAGRLYR